MRGSQPAINPMLPSQKQESIKIPQTKYFRYLLIACILFAGIVVAIICLQAWNYYATPVSQRFRSDLHQQFKPGGSVGHPIGVAGSAMLIGLLSYSLRKRARFLKRWGPLSRWLQFHIFLGIAGPVFITLHTSFKLRGIVAISYWSMLLVVLSGMVGRYLYAQIPHALSGSEFKHQDLNARIEEINSRLSNIVQANDFHKIESIAAFHSPENISGPRALLMMISDDFRWFKRRAAINKILNTYSSLTPRQRRELAALAQERQLQLRKMSLLRASQNMFRYWHVFHLPLAQTMYITMVVHIAVALLTGYF